MATSDDVRELALALPETAEKPSYGTPGFRVGDRLFARLHQDGESLVLRMDRDEREALAEAEPEKFFWTPHYDRHQWIQVRLVAVDREELLELLQDAWRLRAPAPALRRAGVD
ncbi:MAG: hypothetical protein F4Z77_06015 [Dehalococcoidia bacterium]|nr:MmcQ/YjbR family DNA-binding protein [Chloroflexota bacterium]MXW25837.1 hypothetical protein [Dehalococcoidia bacterium]MYA51975.1 hypothetical protein [Dehalococcoidia bacterium]